MTPDQKHHQEKGTRMIDLLIEKAISEILNEASYTEEDIPPYFFLVLPAKKALQYGISTYKLVNFKNKGISDDKRILLWLTEKPNDKDLILIMPGKETVELNNLSRFMYDNPDYWFSGNLVNILRADGTKKITDDTYENFFSVASILSGSKSAFGLISEFSKLLSNVDLGGELSEIRRAIKSTIPHKFKNLDHFVDIVIKVCDHIKKILPKHYDKFDLSYSSIFREVNRLYKSYAKLYKHEGEWINKNYNFNVPPNSKILITNYAAMSISPYGMLSLKRSYPHVKIIDKEDSISKIENKWYDEYSTNDPHKIPSRKKKAK